VSRPKTVYPKPPALPRVELSSGLVKSAARALQLLEFFDDIKRPATVVEITEVLKYPQSSASALLGTLVSMGYLTYNVKTHHYLPSNRVTLLGHWINPNLITDGAMLRMMSEISRRTDDAVMLMTRRNISAQYIHVIQARSGARLHLTLGALLPLAASSSGYTLLSTYSDAEVRKIVNRVNAEMPADGKRVNIAELLDTLSEIRSQGYCFKTGITTPGGGTISMTLPVEAGQPPLAVGIGGVAEIMTARRDFLVSVLREEIDTYLATQRDVARASA
jgi:DNA-binding IclR family transcriptional regulator